METHKSQIKTYNALEVVVFRKTKEGFGGLSNMASGFPIEVNGIKILTSEALYQACRFPHLPDVQEKIIMEKSPMSAKMVGKPFRPQSRPDWDNVRVSIMRWCLQVKLAQNFIEFGRLLESTFDKPIVEDSSKDDYWGAIRDKKDRNVLVGTNALGRLLMELRQNYNKFRYNSSLFYVEPLTIPEFKLYDKEIGVIDERQRFLSVLNERLGMSQKQSIVNISKNYVFEKNNIDEVKPLSITKAETPLEQQSKEKIKPPRKKTLKKKMSSRKDGPTLFDSNNEK